jgi:hypothetical protein
MNVPSLAPGAHWEKADREYWCTHSSHAKSRMQSENDARRIRTGEWILWIHRAKGNVRHMECALKEGHAMPSEVTT